MTSIRVDRKIIDFIKKIKGDKLGGKAMTEIATEAIVRLAFKPKECFSCPLHRDQLAGIETGRQTIAMRYSTDEVKVGWIKVDVQAMSFATRYSKGYGRNIQVVFEQALVEMLTMPKQCIDCPKRDAHG